MGGVVGTLPPSVIRSMAKQYAAGATVDDAMRVVGELRDAGINSTVAVLGEAATTEGYADQHMRELESVFDALRKAGRSDLDVRLGIKPTALGIDVSNELATKNLIAIASNAQDAGRIVEVDMEQLQYVDRTLDMVRSAKLSSYSNVYAVVQAYLHRTNNDVEQLIRDGIPARIVKGTYKEPLKAFQLYESVRENFVALVRQYLEAGVFVGIATHDEYVIVRALNMIRELGVDPANYEFQMIMGVQETLRQSLVDAGHPVRATVHFGSDLHLWSIRRLKENPEIARYAVSGMADAVRHRKAN
ncbi:proline dehydrogenase family protein [Rhodococcus sp. NPDC057529]|uniref:proline dehydrogenase family protein n=1 Tax=Rhodococcus sp. NPDC057529 TaxID=3346158 RepID=UPI003670832A